MRRRLRKSILVALCGIAPALATNAGAQSQPANRACTSPTPSQKACEGMGHPTADCVPTPFWRSSTMHGESVLFVRPDDGGAATGTLLFVPKRIISVKSSDGATVYREGADYQYKLGDRALTLPVGSKIPSPSMKELTPPLNSQPFGLVRRDGKGDILFGASHEYADMQVVVTYEHGRDEWKLPPPKLAERELAGTLRKLRAGEPVKVVLFGDSISAGCNASKWANTAPFQPAYGELLVQHLSRTYKSAVTFSNLSEGGRTSGWGLEHIAAVANEKPDLVILAWGMNDSTGTTGGIAADAFVANLKAQMEAVHKVQPTTEFVLVSSMLPNKQWQLANPDRLLVYRDAMRPLVGPGVAMADVSVVWEAMLQYKPYLDLTGNGVNHPNDFGHRIYTEVLAGLLIER